MPRSSALSFLQWVGGYLNPMTAGGGSRENGLALAQQRGRRAVEKLLATYHSLTADEVASRLGITPADVARLDRERRLLGVTHEGQRLYPEFQFEGNRPLHGLADVLSALDEIGDWTAFNFFVTRDLRLGDRTPLDVLREGDVKAVCLAAAAYGEHQPA